MGANESALAGTEVAAKHPLTSNTFAAAVRRMCQECRFLLRQEVEDALAVGKDREEKLHGRLWLLC